MMSDQVGSVWEQSLRGVFDDGRGRKRRTWADDLSSGLAGVPALAKFGIVGGVGAAAVAGGGEYWLGLRRKRRREKVAYWEREVEKLERMVKVVFGKWERAGIMADGYAVKAHDPMFRTESRKISHGKLQEENEKWQMYKRQHDEVKRELEKAKTMLKKVRAVATELDRNRGLEIVSRGVETEGKFMNTKGAVAAMELEVQELETMVNKVSENLKRSIKESNDHGRYKMQYLEAQEQLEKQKGKLDELRSLADELAPNEETDDYV